MGHLWDILQLNKKSALSSMIKDGVPVPFVSQDSTKSEHQKVVRKKVVTGPEFETAS
jgi:hypothetical protein